MSLQTQESIYNLIPQEPVKVIKPDRHTSKYKSNVKSEMRAERYPYKTIGPAKVPEPKTDQFLKKHHYDEVHKTVTGDDKHFAYPDNERRRPPVPKCEEKPVMGIRTNKNFITVNAVENIMSVARKPEVNFVDTKKGDKQMLETSGLQPKYVNKKEYGKTPGYLVKRQEEIQRAQDEYDSYVAEHMRRGAMIRLTNEERHNVLSGLKINWEELHHAFQGLSVVTDTAPKKIRRERMESEMKQLERDIQLIESHGLIYIAN